MDVYELTRIVYARVQNLDPDNVSKIMGYLLLQDNGDQEMLRLAFGTDAMLHAVISRTKKELQLPVSVPLQVSSHPSSPLVSRHSQLLPLQSSSLLSQNSSRLLPPVNAYLSSTYLPSYNQQDRTAFSNEQLRAIPLQNLEERTYLNFNRATVQNQSPLHEILSPSFEKFPLCSEQRLFSDQLSFLNESLESHNPGGALPNDQLYADMYGSLNAAKMNVDPFQAMLNGGTLRDVSVSSESGLGLTWKPCLYYARGYCKHGSNCRFLHVQLTSDSLSSSSVSNGQGDWKSEDSFAPGSIEKLERELQDLLRGRRAPVSIASLPQLYYERYGKTLQAEGYLTESQRHGKAGFSLTKLLARLKNTVTVIDRPHGQHAVLLADEVNKFLPCREERDDLNVVNPGSRQIYLTFPAESTFTEDDVSTHFRAYGPVQDVRIPYQQKRMFGFVTFVYSETVKVILAKGNPHYICGARVLVKPYKEKGKYSERRTSEREYSRHIPSEILDSSEFYFSPASSIFNCSEAIFQRQLEEKEHILRVEQQQLADMQLVEMQRRLAETETSVIEATAVQNFNGLNGLGQSVELATIPDLHQLQKSTAFGYLFDVLDTDPVEGPQAEQNIHEEQSDGHNLPDSPFTSPQTHSKSISLSLPERIKSLTLDGVGIGSPVLATAGKNTELTCRICMDLFVDPIQLDCNHTFCVQCILKVIRVSKDECPVCKKHIGSQIVKLLESRGLQVFDPSLTMKGIGHTIW
eukprot:c25332_g1_i1 orf=694-2931(-)